MRILPGPTACRRSPNSKLGLEPLALNRIATIDELPDASPKVNSIGRALESLGFTADNATPAITASAATPPVR